MMAGQMMVIFVMAVAAAEVAVGLGIIMAIYRLRDNIDIDELNLLRG
jgi:NADH-quinone oxidoreductase subunit K